MLVVLKKLNHAGRLTYITSVLAFIPIYYLSVVLSSKKFIEHITSIIRKFWWTGVQEDNSTFSIPFRSWDDICQPKDNEGLAIKGIHTINKSFIINAAGRIPTQKNEYLSVVLKSKHYLDKSFGLLPRILPSLFFI
jgi:hypothetical protein